jgi:SET domain-containing protein
MNQGLAFGLTVAKSRIHGKGCFAAIKFGEHQQIAEYVGERIPFAEAERRRCTQGEQGICDIDSEWAIDGSRGGNGTHCINHSCHPNAYVIVSGRRIFIHALRGIAPGEEITTDYRYELYSAQIKCRCQSDGCDEPTRPAGIVGQSEERASENSRSSISKYAAALGRRL